MPSSKSVKPSLSNAIDNWLHWSILSSIPFPLAIASVSAGYRLINTNLTSRTNDKEAKLNRSRTKTSKTLVFQSRTQPSTAHKKNSSPIHNVTEEISFT